MSSRIQVDECASYEYANMPIRIYKDKYMPTEEKSADERTPRAFMHRKDFQKTPKDETRTRTMFGGRKKSVAVS